MRGVVAKFIGQIDQTIDLLGDLLFVGQHFLEDLRVRTVAGLRLTDGLQQHTTPVVIDVVVNLHGVDLFFL